jgi:hypothetical protein
MFIVLGPNVVVSEVSKNCGAVRSLWELLRGATFIYKHDVPAARF